MFNPGLNNSKSKQLHNSSESSALKVLGYSSVIKVFFIQEASQLVTAHPFYTLHSCTVNQDGAYPRWQLLSQAEEAIEALEADLS